jgi:hypothetical protein
MVGRKLVAAFLLAWALNGQAGPLSEVEITADPVQNGTQIFTLRMTPGEAGVYDLLVFDCTYHQEFVPETSDQGSRKKVHEPEVFTVRRRDVKLVEELDLNVSFRVPIDKARLVEIYGETAFDPKFPVTVSRIRVSAMKAGVVVWWYEFPARGLFKPKETGAYKAGGKASRG